MTALIGDATIHPATLQAMRDMSEGGTWYAYQNRALDSASLGHLQFLKVGPTCTYKEPPARMPDTQAGLGWRYILVGMVDLESGDIKPIEEKA